MLCRMQIVLPPAVARSSFQDAFSVFKEFNKVQWSAMPVETLYDTDRIISEWGEMDFMVYKTPALQELPALVEPESAFPRYAESTVVQHVHLYLHDLCVLDHHAAFSSASGLFVQAPRPLASMFICISMTSTCLITIVQHCCLQ